MLWTLPILMFLFFIYYSVSAFAGIVWRNTIMCIVAVVLFWCACFAGEVIHGIVDVWIMQPRRVIKTVQAGDDMLSVSESGTFGKWNAANRRWDPVFAVESNEPQFVRQANFLGPVYDAKGKRIVAIERQFSRSRLLVGRPDQEYEREEMEGAPSGSIQLFQSPNDEFYIFESNGISRLGSSDTGKSKAFSLFGQDFRIGRQRGVLSPAGPRGYDFAADISAACMDPRSGTIFAYGLGKVQRLDLDKESQRYQVTTEKDVLDKEVEILMAAAGDSVFLATEKGEVQLLDSDSLETSGSFEPFGKGRPRFAISSASGKYVAVLSHNNNAWLYDIEAKKELTSRIPGQGGLTSIEFAQTGEADRLNVADRVDRVRSLALPELSVAESYAPTPSIMDRIFRYGIEPLYFVFPKPGNLKQTASALTTEELSIAQSPNQGLEGKRQNLKIWEPVYHSAIFTLVMLLISCIYIARQEF